MLDFGFSEILLTSAIALVVLGPERLPKVARQVGNWMGRARSMARQLSEQLEREVNAEELLKTQEKAKLASANRVGPAAPAAPQQPAAAVPVYPTPLAPDGQISVAADSYPPVGHPPGAPASHVPPPTSVGQVPVTRMNPTASASSADSSQPPNE